MKILQVNKFLYPKGGSESYMFELSKALNSAGHEVRFWGMEDSRNIIDDTDKCFAEHADFGSMGSIEKIAKSFTTIYSRDNRQKIAHILDVFQPDIVHLHNYNFQLTPSILPEIKQRGIKIVYTAHDSQLVCPYHRLYNFQKDIICDKCTNGRFIHCTLDRCFDGSLLKSLLGTFESYLYHGLAFYNKYFDAVISPSPFLASYLQKSYRGEIHILPNFINDPKLLLGREKRNFMLYFGRISKEKGIIQILPILESLGIEIKIIGPIPEETEITGSSNIHFLGPKYGLELFEYIADAKFVIQPSKGYENCPMSVIESFACGTPVIAPNHSGFRDLIEDGKNGFLVRFDQPDIGTILKELFAGYNDEYSRYCIQTFHQKHTKEVHMPKIIDIYEKVLR